MKVKQRELAKKISAGLFVNSVDLVLFAASLGLNLYVASFKGKDPVKILSDSFKLADWFQEKLLKASSAYAKQKGYLKRIKQELAMSQAGENRLKQILPEYHQHRPWDGRLHLITYDIKEKYKKKRNRLASWLMGQKAIMLQKSVWVSVKDLSRELHQANFIYQDEGIVLVSSLKTGENINGKPLRELVESWYQLTELNRRYDNFLSWVNFKKEMTNRDKFIFKMRYLAILKDDPQLPFELLPKNWQGDKAYKLYQQKLNI